MSEKPQSLLGRVSDAFFGTNGVSKKFKDLNLLNQERSGHDAAIIVRELQKRLGGMYAIAHFIHYR